MANNKIYIKRTSTSGNKPTTGQIANGELAVNMTDGIMYSTNGSVVFEIGANTTNSRVTGNLTVKAIIANGSLGTNGQVLTTNATAVYWADAAGGGAGGGYYKGGSSTIGTLANQGQNLFRVNANTLNTNTTIVTGENAQATGPISVTSGVTLTVQSGGRVSIV
jgi:hypothetical protein